MSAVLCPPCDIDLHDLCWWFDGDETADGPCECSCHADQMQFVGQPITAAPEIGHEPDQNGSTFTGGQS